MSQNNDRIIWELRLFIAGSTPTSQRAIASLKAICDKYLCDCYSLEVLDLAEDPSIAEVEQIFAVPTLIRKFPLPVRKIIGDFSDTERVLRGLEWYPQTSDENNR